MDDVHKEASRLAFVVHVKDNQSTTFLKYFMASYDVTQVTRSCLSQKPPKKRHLKCGSNVWHDTVDTMIPSHFLVFSVAGTFICRQIYTEWLPCVCFFLLSDLHTVLEIKEFLSYRLFQALKWVTESPQPCATSLDAQLLEDKPLHHSPKPNKRHKNIAVGNGRSLNWIVAEKETNSRSAQMIGTGELGGWELVQKMQGKC